MSQCFDHNFWLNEICGVGKLIKNATNMSEIDFS
jgi:hypothetical protein